jgi:DNA-binding MarR family transcriptional regulator
MSGFMRYFLVHLNPILHRSEYRGRSFSELEIIVCMALSLTGSLRPGGLSRSLRIEKGTLTSVIRRLRELGLIERAPIAGDERGYLVSLTGAGRDFIGHLDTQRREGFGELFAAMDSEDADAAARGIDLLTTYLKEWEHDHGAMD